MAQVTLHIIIVVVLAGIIYRTLPIIMLHTLVHIQVLIIKLIFQNTAQPIPALLQVLLATRYAPEVV